MVAKCSLECCLFSVTMVNNLLRIDLRAPSRDVEVGEEYEICVQPCYVLFMIANTLNFHAELSKIALRPHELQ